jgi:spermidine/putrescine transport system permease protein
VGSEASAWWGRTGLAVTAGALLFLYLPIAVLIGMSFNETGGPSAWGGFTTQWYSEAFRDSSLLDAARTTLTIALVSTAIAVLLGTPLAIGLHRSKSRLLGAIVYVPTVVPDIVLAIALLTFYNLFFNTFLGVGLGIHTIVIAHSVFCTAFVAVIVAARLRNFDESLLEASLDLGADEWRTLLRILLPAIAPAIVAGALVSFTLSVDEFIIAYFTAGGETTLPMKIYSSVRFGVTPEINALSTVVVLGTLLLTVLALRLRRRDLA